tara:strand:+ start:131 stop:427 length:297 start_codon:yes stop_codon:yes gene_type:complete
MLSVGSRAQVWHNNAKKTKGGLTKKDLKKNKHGRIVSKKLSMKANKENRLKKAGYLTTKGKFGSFKKSVKKSVKKSKKPCKKGSKRKVVYCIKSKKKK